MSRSSLTFKMYLIAALLNTALLFLAALITLFWYWSDNSVGFALIIGLLGFFIGLPMWLPLYLLVKWLQPVYAYSAPARIVLLGSVMSAGIIFYYIFFDWLISGRITGIYAILPFAGITIAALIITLSIFRRALKQIFTPPPGN